MAIPQDVLDKDKGLTDWSILSGYRGSIAHGMYLPNSDPNSVDDKDVMSVCVPPMDYYVGIKHYGRTGTKEVKHNEWDVVIYEALKFIRLLEKGNPNVLCMLWLEENYYIKKTFSGDILIDNRSAFSGRHVYYSFVGYAKGQLHRMTHGAKIGHMGERRRELIAKYGYDTKNAAHLIRLLRMGTEFLLDGELHVLRHDAPELLDIKTGKWTLEQIKKESDHWFKMADEAHKSSDLPLKPDHEEINDIAVQVVTSGAAFLEGFLDFEDY